MTKTILFEVWDFEYCGLLGIWCLEFGAFYFIHIFLSHNFLFFCPLAV